MTKMFDLVIRWMTMIFFLFRTLIGMSKVIIDRYQYVGDMPSSSVTIQTKVTAQGYVYF